MDHIYISVRTGVVVMHLVDALVEEGLMQGAVRVVEEDLKQN
jgi:hypothetical protein